MIHIQNRPESGARRGGVRPTGRRVLRGFTEAMLAMALLGAAPALVAAQQAGSAGLEGIVFDSTAMKPLADARVAVIGTRSSTTSDARGRFHLDHVPAGKYWVSFFHPRLQELGVSSPSRQVEFADGRVSRVVLSVPSETTILEGWCLAEQPGAGYGAVGGTVTDSVTGVPMPHAIVTLTPLVGGRPLEVRTDDAGYYRICNAPANVEFRLQAHFGQSSGRSEFVQVPPQGARHEDLLLLMSSTGKLTGIVKDYVSGQPVQGAVIQVLGTDASQLTDAQGKFLIQDLPPGRHLVTTEYLGYEQRIDSVTIFSEETVEIEVRMATKALEVEGLVVTARSRFGRRTSIAEAKRADLITRSEIEPLLGRVQHAGDLLRNMNVPGLSVREVMVEDLGGIVVPGLCVEVSRRSGGSVGCYQAAVYLNDVKQPFPDQILRNLDPNIIDRIEVLSPVDAQFQFGTAAANGAILIYTR